MPTWREVSRVLHGVRTPDGFGVCYSEAGFSPPGPEEGRLLPSAHSPSFIAEVISILAIAEHLALLMHTRMHTHAHTRREKASSRQDNDTDCPVYRGSGRCSPHLSWSGGKKRDGLV